MIKSLSKFLRFLLYFFASPFILVIFAWHVLGARFVRRDFDKPRLVFGSTPIISFSHWSRLLAAIGFDSTSYVNSVYGINDPADWDIVLNPKKSHALNAIHTLMLFARSLSKFDVFVISCDGFLIGNTKFWKLQSHAMKFAGCKSVVFPYGGDSYIYSKVRSNLTLQGLLFSYPAAARTQKKIVESVEYWVENADIFIPGSMGMDGFGRWDLPTPSPFQIDLDVWKPTSRKNTSDGISGPVVVAHAPNHRGFKGTEMIIRIVTELQNEGLDIQFFALEKVSNSTVRDVLTSKVDILVEQILFSGYALNAIEGMASGLPVISNLEDKQILDHLRIWSFLDKTPIVSADYTTLKNVLRELINYPELRSQIGRESRRYVQEFHGKESCRYMFESILEKLRNTEFDLQRIYMPKP